MPNGDDDLTTNGNGDGQTTTPSPVTVTNADLAAAQIKPPKPQSYHVKLKDGREFNVTTDGAAPDPMELTKHIQRQDLQAGWNQPYTGPDPGNLLAQAKESIQKANEIEQKYGTQPKAPTVGEAQRMGLMQPPSTPAPEGYSTGQQMYDLAGVMAGIENAALTGDTTDLKRDWESGKTSKAIWTPIQHYGQKIGSAISGALDPILNNPNIPILGRQVNPDISKLLQFGFPTDPKLAALVAGSAGVVPPQGTTYGGMAAAYPESLGTEIDKWTSPGNLAFAGVGAAGGLAARAGYEGVAGAADVAQKILSTPLIAEGGYNVYKQPTLAGKLGGFMEAAIGASPFAGDITNILRSARAGGEPISLGISDVGKEPPIQLRAPKTAGDVLASHNIGPEDVPKNLAQGADVAKFSPTTSEGIPIDYSRPFFQDFKDYVDGKISREDFVDIAGKKTDPREFGDFLNPDKPTGKLMDDLYNRDETTLAPGAGEELPAKAFEKPNVTPQGDKAFLNNPSQETFDRMTEAGYEPTGNVSPDGRALEFVRKVLTGKIKPGEEETILGRAREEFADDYSDSDVYQDEDNPVTKAARAITGILQKTKNDLDVSKNTSAPSGVQVPATWQRSRYPWEGAKEDIPTPTTTTGYPWETEEKAAQPTSWAKLQEKIPPGTKPAPEGVSFDKYGNVARSEDDDLTQLYDSIPFKDRGGARKTAFYDPGNRLTPEESRNFTQSPTVQMLSKNIDSAMDDILQSTGKGIWSDKLEGTGIMLDPTSYGVHIPNPATDKSSILIDPFHHIETAQESGLTPHDAAQGIVRTMMHEAAHVGHGDEDSDFNFNPDDVDPNDSFMRGWANEAAKGTAGDRADTGHAVDWLNRLGDNYVSFGSDKAAAATDKIEKAITDKTGNYSPEVQRLLSIYKARKGRAATTPDYLSGTQIESDVTPSGKKAISGTTKPDVGGTIRPEQFTLKDEQGNDIGLSGMVDERLFPGGRGKPPSKISEILNTPRALNVGLLHLSAPFRQGLPLWSTSAWWSAWKPMLKSYASEDMFNGVMKSITGDKSYPQAVKDGLRFTNNLNNREEALGANWTKNLPGFKQSGRAYTAYLDSLRMDSYKSLIQDAKDAGLNPERNDVLRQGIANFVNNASGRGSLGSAEKYAGLLNEAFFSPRKIAATIQMMNPNNYLKGDPFVRKQYLRSFLAMTGAWMTMAGLAKMAGAQVSLDPTNSDFGKIKIGNTRFDPSGGFQPYLVAATRLVSGKDTSSTTGKTADLNYPKFGGPTRGSVLADFASQKLNTPWKFAYDLAFASQGRPFNVPDRTVRMFMPIIAQDVVDLAKEDPRLLPAAIPAAVGIGEQTYSGGQRGTILPQSWNFTLGQTPKHPRGFGAVRFR